MGWMTLLPPLLVLALVLWKKEVLSALLVGLFVSELLLLVSGGQSGPVASVGLGALATIDRIVAVVADADNARVLVFALLIGSLLAFMYRSGGVAAVIDRVVGMGLVKSRRQALGLTAVTGTVIFVESNLSVLASGLLSRGLYDRYGLSRAHLAYIVDSTSAPICILILLNGWGAFVLALLGGYDLGMSSASVLWGSVPFNFYALITLAIVVYSVASGKFHGPLGRVKATEGRIGPDAHEGADGGHEYAPTRSRFMILPLLAMIFGMVGFMLWTGNGSIAAGSGSRSILYATVLGCLVAYLLLVFDRRFGHKELVEIGLQGMNDLMPVVLILLMSIAFGASLKALGTGAFIAGIVSGGMAPILIAPALFIAGALMSFFTGTSWGTFAILVPIAMPIVQTLGLPPAFILSAVLGGGVFGDHCSPISDTTIVSSLASGCDHLEHVRTQIPYALTAAAVTIAVYLAAGAVVL
ncbi:Na+/H+ antiporter NhaC family protein [Pseudokordiimonas caeni]|uniref:Na+/H+ antiporter NhaC family protein n=1 Tax=Pseudokordiimonas caeni TaxID=2997908 RepID=UPI00359397AC